MRIRQEGISKIFQEYPSACLPRPQSAWWRARQSQRSWGFLLDVTLGDTSIVVYDVHLPDVCDIYTPAPATLSDLGSIGRLMVALNWRQRRNKIHLSLLITQLPMSLLLLAILYLTFKE